MKIYDFERFKTAQASKYNGFDRALEELGEGAYQTRWVWYVFPQMRGLGRGYNADFYGMESIREAVAYLEDELLGARLRKAADALLAHEGKLTAKEIFGREVSQVQACMTLFDRAAPDDVFGRVLDAFFAGKRDVQTVKMLNRH